MTSKEREEFKEAVYQIVAMIPRGRATSYGAIARAAGMPGMARLAGRIMGECPASKTGLPAHRVVNSQGILSGCHAFGGSRMQQLLESEGIRVSGRRIADWKKVFWDPMEEIGRQP